MIKDGSKVLVQYPDCVIEAVVVSVIGPTVRVRYPHPETQEPWTDVVYLGKLKEIK